MGTPQDPPYPFSPPPFPMADPDAPPDPDEEEPPPAPLPSLAVHPSAGANKRSSHPPPASEPWLDRPLTAEELKAARIRLSRLTDTDLVRAYDAALEICRLDRGVPPVQRSFSSLLLLGRNCKGARRRRHDGPRSLLTDLQSGQFRHAKDQRVSKVQGTSLAIARRNADVGQ